LFSVICFNSKTYVTNCCDFGLVFTDDSKKIEAVSNYESSITYKQVEKDTIEKILEEKNKGV